jgi:DNA-binding transcriptional MerR regulator
MNGLLPIGAFSRASSISVRALRDYHESGLLVPVAVDSSTGYRSYTVDQLGDALAIVRLRALDVPLMSVQRIIQARDREVTRILLLEHEQVMRTRLAEAEQIVEALQRGVPAATTPPHIVKSSSMITLSCTATVPVDGVWNWLTTVAKNARCSGLRPSPGGVRCWGVVQRRDRGR